MRTLPLLIAVLGLGCGRSSGTDGGMGGSATLSGAVSGTEAVTATGAYDSNGVLGFAIENQASGAGGLNVAITLTGTTLQAGTFTPANVTKAGVVLTEATGIWVASAHDSNQPDQGTFSLTVTDPGPALTGSNGNRVWTSPHGSLDATAKPAMGSGATGEVTVHVTF